MFNWKYTNKSDQVVRPLAAKGRTIRSGEVLPTSRDNAIRQQNVLFMSLLSFVMTFEKKIMRFDLKFCLLFICVVYLLFSNWFLIN